jgi:superfamily I DNA/RNA helicase
MTRRQASRALNELRAHGLPAVELEKYDGQPTDAVKVETIKRAKGLEFKQVLIPGIRGQQVSLGIPEEDSERESWELTRRGLYVAMTRARDGLWMSIS